MSDLYIFESPESESVVICERHPEGELPFASVFPGVPMTVPPRAEVRALARARAERIIEALAADDLDLPTSGKSLAEMVQDATGFPEHWKTDRNDVVDEFRIGPIDARVDEWRDLGALIDLTRWPFREE